MFADVEDTIKEERKMLIQERQDEIKKAEIENAQNKGQKKKKGPVGVRGWAQPQNDPAVVHVGPAVPIRPNIQATAQPRRVIQPQPQNNPAVVHLDGVPFTITQTTAQPRRGRVIQPRNGRPIMAYEPRNVRPVLPTRLNPAPPVQPQNRPSGPNVQTTTHPQNGPSGSNGPTTNATRPSDAFV